MNHPSPVHCWLPLLAMAILLTAGADAADRTFTCRNWLEYDWPRTLLHYDITAQPGEYLPGKVELRDAQGVPVECQLVTVEKHPDGSLKRGRVSFYAELMKGETWSYTLAAVKRPAAFPARLVVKKKGDFLEISAPEVGVRIPAVGSKTSRKPIEISDVPPPIIGWRTANGQWVGKSWLESDRKVTGWSQRVVADGPLYKEYAYEVRYAPGTPPRDKEGYYRVRVRVEAEKPLIFVAEEYDFGCATAGKDALMLVLNDGVAADTIIRSSYAQPPGSKSAYQVDGIDPPGNESDFRAWKEAITFTEERDHTKLYPSHDWGLGSQWYGLYHDADQQSSFVGLVTLHTGAWRLTSEGAPIRWTKDGRVLARFPTSIYLQGDPRNPFSTGEIDPDVPQSLGRRMWALVLGSRPGVAKDGRADVSAMRRYRCYDGVISLNDYKDWQLTWEEKPLTRPRVIITPEALATLKANLDRCPGKEQIVNFALLTGNAETALAEAKRAEHWLNELFRLMGRISYSHYRQTQSDYQVIYEAESALAHPAVTGELRERLRAKIAARCYMLANADYIPRGAAVHMGNPNMAINRYMGLPLYAQLIADHPMAKSWLDDAYVYTKWKTSYNVTAGGGTFRENPGYATYGPTIFLTTAAIALRNAGYDIDTFEPLKDIGRYFRDIETPVAPPMGIANMNRGHAKWLKGRHVRVLPAFGNGQHIAGGQTQMLLASLTARSDPAYAAEMMQSFYEDGGYLGTEMDLPFMWLYWNPDIAPKPMMRTDKLITGFGGVLRAHSTSPEETYAVLRNGYTQSHWNPDQGTLVFNSRGVCISPATGWGYNSMEQGICRDSRICFGEPLADHEHGRVDTNIVDYGSLPSMGYLLGQQTFRKEWDPTKTLTNNFDWSRQVMLLKSTRPDGPNYLVVRDTTQGASPMKRWWYQWFITKDTNITPIPGGVRATGIEKSDVKLDVRFLEPAEAKVGVKGLTNPPRGYEGWDFAQVSVPQEPDKGYFTVFYPSKGAEPGLGTTEKLAEGVVKITTPESVDYVFCAVENPVVFKDALVEINAYAGAVRIYPDRVLLVNASGQQGSVAYKGVKAEGIGPFEHVAAVSPAKTETVAAGRRLAPVARPEGEGMLITVDGTGGANAVVTGSGLKGWVLARGGKVTYAMTEGTGTVGYKGFYIKGEAPFVCVHEPGKVTLTADGRRRIFQMPIPEDLVPASLLPPKESLPENIKKALQGGWTNWPWAVDLKVDGVGGMQAGWYNGLMTIGLDDGKHIAVISPYTNPPVWKDNAYTRLLP